MKMTVVLILVALLATSTRGGPVEGAKNKLEEAPGVGVATPSVADDTNITTELTDDLDGSTDDKDKLINEASKKFSVYVRPSEKNGESLQDWQEVSERMDVPTQSTDGFATTSRGNRHINRNINRHINRKARGGKIGSPTTQSSDYTATLSTAQIDILKPSLIPSKYTKSGNLRFKDSSVPFGEKQPKRSSRGRSPIEPSSKLIYNKPIPAPKSRSVESRGQTPHDDILTDILSDLSLTSVGVDVQKVLPSYNTFANVSHGDQELSIYGKDINVERAVLEKEIFNYQSDQKPTKLVQVFTTKENKSKRPKLEKSPEKKKMTFKAKDVASFQKKHMKMIKNFGKGEVVAEMEEGVMLPATDGSGTAFVPDILLRDTEFLLAMANKKRHTTEFSLDSLEFTGSSSAELIRPGRDTKLMAGMPYSFGFIVDDEYTGNYQTRQETADNHGVVNGCYQVLEPTGLVRTVLYRADHDGFQVLSMTETADKTPCSGLESAQTFNTASSSNFATQNHNSVSQSQSNNFQQNQNKFASSQSSFGKSNRNYNSASSSTAASSTAASSSSSSSASYSDASSTSLAKSALESSFAHNNDHRNQNQNYNDFTSSTSQKHEHNEDHSSSQHSSSKYESNNIFNSISDLNSASSRDNFINFPFVLIPVTTFVDLRDKGLIDGSVQSFGAFVQPYSGSKEKDSHGYTNKIQQTDKKTHYGNQSENKKQSTHQTDSRLSNTNQKYQQNNSPSTSYRPTAVQNFVNQRQPRIQDIYQQPRFVQQSNFVGSSNVNNGIGASLFHTENKASSSKKSSSSKNAQSNNRASATSFNQGSSGLGSGTFNSFQHQKVSNEKSESSKSSSSSTNSYSSSLNLGNSQTLPSFTPGPQNFGTTFSPQPGYLPSLNTKPTTIPSRHHSVLPQKTTNSYLPLPSQFKKQQSFNTGFSQPSLSTPSFPISNRGNQAAHFSSSSKSSESSSSSKSSSLSSSSSSSFGLNHHTGGPAVQTRSIPHSAHLKQRLSIAPSRKLRFGSNEINKKKSPTSAPVPEYLASLSNSIKTLQGVVTERNSNVLRSSRAPLVRQSRTLQPDESLHNDQVDKSNFRPPTELEYFTLPTVPENDWIPIINIVKIDSKSERQKEDKKQFDSKRKPKSTAFVKIEQPINENFVVAETVAVDTLPQILDQEFAHSEIVESPVRFVRQLDDPFLDNFGVVFDGTFSGKQKNDGFGHFHTRESSQKISNDGSNFRYNTHFFSQA